MVAQQQIGCDPCPPFFLPPSAVPSFMLKGPGSVSTKYSVQDLRFCLKFWDHFSPVYYSYSFILYSLFTLPTSHISLPHPHMPYNITFFDTCLSVCTFMLCAVGLSLSLSLSNPLWPRLDCPYSRMNIAETRLKNEPDKDDSPLALLHLQTPRELFTFHP